MRFLFRLILWLMLLSPFAIAAAVWFALEDHPEVVARQQLSHQDVARARNIIKRNDPRQFPAGSLQTVQVSQADINLAANYLLQQLGGAARVDIGHDSANLAATARIPMLPVKPYVNIHASVTEVDGRPHLGKLRLGQVPIPTALTNVLQDLALAKLFGVSRQQYQLADEVIEELTLTPGSAAITYVWQPELVQRARDSLLSNELRESLVVYYNELSSLHAQGQARSGSLASALKPLFAEAERRSRENNPVAENRALLLVLGAWANGRGMSDLVPQDQRQGTLAPYRLSLAGRKDLGQHFLTSAALVSAVDTALSDAVGLFKEVKDADGGSGFSFADLAADRTGTKFGELATGSTRQARRVQQQVAAGITEPDIMPSIRGLPEAMQQAEFERRFGGIDSPRYHQVSDEIERRVAGCRLYRDH